MTTNRGGQANEAGSVHRRSVAAFIACYGLLGWPVPGLRHPADAYPVYIEFETDQPTDDFTVRFADGSSAFVSAKRVCGNDNAFRDTVDQWFEQALTLNPNDLLVLAVARARGAITELNAALDKRRRRIGARSKDEKDALAAFDDASAGKSRALRKTVGEHALLLRVDASGSPSPEYEMARTAIGGRLVPDDQAAAALGVLSKAFHDQAAAASGSGLDMWLEILSSAGITVFADGNGPRGAQRQAEKQALAQYNRILGEPRGRIDLTLLAQDLPNLFVDDMVGGLRAQVSLRGERADGVPLLALLRGWERFLLVGLPGAGKSTAARELAAACATDDEAPQPILVDLRALVRDHEPANVRAHHLVQCAARVVDREVRPSLESAFDLALHSGSALLVLDGLDEAHSRAAQLAEALVGVFEHLPPEVGVVLTTRASGSAVASRLGLPVARLSRPRDLEKTLTALLQHIAAQRLDEAERALWVQVRQEWLAEVQRDVSSLMEVPLLAVILVLMLADNDPSAMSTSPARLLHDAVIDSAQRWESRRDAPPDGRRSALTQRMLTDAFAEIGHVLLLDPDADRSAVTRQVSTLYSSHRWRRAPAEAEELASEAVDFWDDVIAVFVFDSDGRSVPRSRVFVEVASAMRATAGDHEAMQTWVVSAISDDSARNALALAAQLDERVLDSALGLSATSIEAAQFLARTALNAATPLGENRSIVLARVLREHALTAEAVAAVPGSGDDCDGNRESPSGGERDALFGGSQYVDGRVWPPVAMLCLLPMPSEVRQEALDGLLELDGLDDEQRVLGRALVALASAEDRSLSDDEIAAVQAALLIPLPPKTEPRHVDGVMHFQTGPPLRLGLPELAEQATPRIAELGTPSVEAIKSIASRCAWDRGRRILAGLTLHGADVTDFFQGSFRKTMATLADIAATLGPRPEVHLLQQIWNLDREAVAASGPKSWRMKEVRDLTTAAGWHSITLPDLTTAFFDEVDLLHDWLIVLCRRRGLDPAVPASQARRAIEDGEHARLLDDLLDIPPLDFDIAPLAPGQLSPDSIGRLERAAGSSSRWVRRGAERLLDQEA